MNKASAFLTERFDVRRVHEGALRLLAEVGLELPDETQRRKVAGARGLRVSGNRVFVAGDVAGAILAEARANVVYETPDAPLRFHASGEHSHWYLDLDGHLRQYETKDMIECCRLTRALADARLIAASACLGLPHDVPAALQELVQMQMSAKYLGRMIQSCVSEPKAAAFAVEMLRVMGAKWYIGLHIVSPLKLHGGEWDITLAMLDRIGRGEAEDCVDVAGMPILGATAPCDWHAAWAQSVAEVVGAAAVLKALGAPKIRLHPTLYACDLRSGMFVFGTPEHALITLLEGKVRDFYMLPRRVAKSFTSCSLRPDQQAASEKTLHTLLALLDGYRQFTGLGILNVDDIFSPAQLMIDVDLAAQMTGSWRGAADPGPVDAVEAVRQGIEAGGFFATELTRDRHRSLYWYPRVFTREGLGRSLSGDCPDLVRRASEAARAEIGKVPADPVLDRERTRELERILAAARKDLAGA